MLRMFVNTLLRKVSLRGTSGAGEWRRLRVRRFVISTIRQIFWGGGSNRE